MTRTTQMLVATAMTILGVVLGVGGWLYGGALFVAGLIWFVVLRIRG